MQYSYYCISGYHVCLKTLKRAKSLLSSSSYLRVSYALSVLGVVGLSTHFISPPLPSPPPPPLPSDIEPI